jgi:hypothetical protein
VKIVALEKCYLINVGSIAEASNLIETHGELMARLMARLIKFE